MQGISTGKYKSVHSSMLCLPGESKHWLKVVEIYYSRRNKNTKLKPAMKWAVYGKITRDMKALLPYQSADLYQFSYRYHNLHNSPMVWRSTQIDINTGKHLNRHCNENRMQKARRFFTRSPFWLMLLLSCDSKQN